jgi:hypothetical protein
MTKNTLTIEINQPISKVFEFTINPVNTPHWIDHLEIEETNEWPPELGTIYRNRTNTTDWSEYIVSAIEKNKIFELVAKDGKYHVRYTYTPIEPQKTKIEYFEWVDYGELEEPFTFEVLEKLKNVVGD